MGLNGAECGLVAFKCGFLDIMGGLINEGFLGV